MISAVFLLLAAQAAAPQAYDPSLDPKRYDGCVRAIDADARKVVQFATEWQALGGGLPARHCLALAQLHLGENTAAATTLEGAASVAAKEHSSFAADLWSQAGNAALLAGDAARADKDLSAAILAASGQAATKIAGVYIDRARARADLGNSDGARADLAQAQELDPKNVDSWLLGAALARRMGDLKLAQTEIATAARLAPEDADVLFERGNIEAAAGATEKAAQFWGEARAKAPGTEAARLATRALADLEKTGPR